MASRLTFRDKCPDVAWQKQLRDKYLVEGTPPVPHLDVKRAIVRPISRRMAEQVILKYEWLGTMSGTSLHFGIFYGAFCAGVTCVGVNGNGTGGPWVAQYYGIERSGLCTLARGACVHWAPSGTNSKIVSLTCRLISKRANSKLIVAYSDSDAGEIGTIYQACNWIYVGLSKDYKKSEAISPDGRIYSDRWLEGNAAKSQYKTQKEYYNKLIDAGWTIQPMNMKGRYVYILDRSDKALVSRIESMRQPYP